MCHRLIAKGVRVIRVGARADAESPHGPDRGAADGTALGQQREQLTRDLKGVKASLEQPLAPGEREELQERLLDLQMQLRNLSVGLLQAKSVEEAEVVCTTCISAGLGFLKGIAFPFVLMDEATQAMEPAALIPIFQVRQGHGQGCIGRGGRYPPPLEAGG